LPPDVVAAAAESVLRTADPHDKVALSRRHVAAWREGRLAPGGIAAPPDRPARPALPHLRPPREMPRRRAGGSLAGRIALLHALAHIELNAIDLAWDLVARFDAAALPREFHEDWVAIAGEEAEHFALVAGRLEALGSSYGALPAHDGLWEAAQATAHDLLARLAIVPLVLEARGLDVTPTMIERLQRLGDPDSAAVLQIIYRDEIGHVAAGRRWFHWLCARRGEEPAATYRVLVARYFKGGLKPPFNHAARAAAGLELAFYDWPPTGPQPPARLP
jgi:uncharacterized ferritin-like protein (DUF455 family)